MRNDEKDPNWTNRRRWSPRNLGTYGLRADSNVPEDVRTSEEVEPLERWHNREFYRPTEGYATILESGLPESTGRHPEDVLEHIEGKHDVKNDPKITS